MQMKRLIAATASLGLLLGALCGCGQTTPAAGQSGAAASSAQPTPPPEDDVLTVDPLTGGNLDYPGQRPVAVMVNSDASQFNQWGVADAEVVIEGVSSGQATSMMCLFPSVESVPKVGPVAEGSDLFLQFALPLNVIPLQIGKTVYASNLLNVLGYQDLDGEYAGVTCFDFDKDRGAATSNEYCWYTTAALIQDGLNLYGLNSMGDTRALFHFGTSLAEAPAAAEGGPERTAEMLDIVYGDNTMVALSYDAGSGLYTRSNASGNIQTDENNGAAVSFQNVLVLYCSAGSKDDAHTRDYSLASGTGLYLTQGAWRAITWQKGGATDPLQLFDSDGSVLTVNPGRSYVGIYGGFGSQRLVLYDSNWAEQTLPANPAYLPYTAPVVLETTEPAEGTEGEGDAQPAEGDQPAEGENPEGDTADAQPAEGDQPAQ